MRARWLLALVAVGCVSHADRVHEHMLRAQAYEARGMYDAAAGERLRAEREREKMARSQTMIYARDDR